MALTFVCKEENYGYINSSVIEKKDFMFSFNSLADCQNLMIQNDEFNLL